MKILLIYPHFLEDRLQSDDIQAPPMGLYWVGAVLKENGYDVEILNWHSIPKTPERIREALSRFRKLQGSRQAAEYARQCEKALGSLDFYGPKK